MREEVVPPGSWEKDSEAASCKICAREFSIARRKHHCRYVAEELFLLINNLKIRPAGLLLAPAEGFSRGFLALRAKKIPYAVLANFWFQ